MPTNSLYPLPAFHFSVKIAGDSGETSFKEVSGLSREVSTEEYREGGENRFLYQLPTTVKNQPLKVKRGLLSGDSKLAEWCRKTLEEGLDKKIELKMVEVHLLNEKHQTVKSWNFCNAYPIKWEVESFDAMKNDIAVESIEFHYTYFTQK